MLAKQKENDVAGARLSLFICKTGRIGPNSAMVGREIDQQEQPFTPPLSADFPGGEK
jgi:hypothetical protein